MTFRTRAATTAAGSTLRPNRRAAAPSVATLSASGISASAATLNGTVNPNGAATTYHFQYGTSNSYGSSTATASVGSGRSAVNVSAALSGLSSATTYHFRLVASNSVGTRTGSDMTLTTAAGGGTGGGGTGGGTGGGSSYDQTVLADAPVAFWDMSGSVSEPDLTGNGHVGSYKGGAPASAGLPDGEKAADFNGSSQYMTVPSSSVFSIPTTGQMTWEAWIRPDVLQFKNASSDAYVDWMGKCEVYSPSCEWEARMYSTSTPEGRCNRLSAYVFNPSAGLGSAADWQLNCNLLQAGQWLHVVGEYQTKTTPAACSSAYPGTINIWVNGVEQNFSYHAPTGCMSQYKITPKAGSSPLDIGTMALDTWFQGAVGKVAIYDSLLSQAQINAHFTAMTGAQPSGSCANTCTIPVPTP